MQPSIYGKASHLHAFSGFFAACCNPEQKRVAFDRTTGKLNGLLSVSARSILRREGWVASMRLKTIGAAAGVLLLVFCFLSGGCAHPKIPSSRDDSFLPYTGAKVGPVSLREFLGVRTAVVYDGGQVIFNTNTRAFHTEGPVFGIGLASAIDRQGYFLTAAHCVEKGPFTLVSFEKGHEQARTARVVWRGDVSKNQPDLALLQVPFPLQDVFEWTPGFTNREPIVATGLGEFPNHVIKFQFMGGKIFGQDPGSVSVLPHYIFISHDAPLHPGDSGGPLATTDGRLVGINCDGVVPHLKLLPFVTKTPYSEAQRPDLEWLRQLIEQDAAAQSGTQTNKNTIHPDAHGTCSTRRSGVPAFEARETAERGHGGRA